jgi:hypothetical protein
MTKTRGVSWGGRAALVAVLFAVSACQPPKPIRCEGVRGVVRGDLPCGFVDGVPNSEHPEDAEP